MDNQEVAVTVITTEKYLLEFDKLQTRKPLSEKQTIIGKMFEVFSRIYEKLSGNDTVSHKLFHLMYAQTQFKGEIRTFNKRFHANPNRTGFDAIEGVASDKLKGAAKYAWSYLDALYEHQKKDGALKKFFIGAHKGNFLSKVYKDFGMPGVTMFSKVTEMAEKMADTDTYTMTERANISKAIKMLLPNKDTYHGLDVLVDEVKLADEVVGLDMQSLDTHIIDDIIDNGFSEQSIKDNRDIVLNQLEKSMRASGIKVGSEYTKAKEFLLHQMMGIQKPKKYRLHAANNADMLLAMYTDNKGIDADTVNLLDQYLTLEAMSRQLPEEVLNVDGSNLKEIIAIHKHSVKLFKKVEGKGPQYRKGYIGGRMDPYWEYEYMSVDAFNAMKDEGWQSFGRSEDGKFVHAKRQNTYLVYNKGAIPTRQQLAKGGKIYDSAAEMLADLNEKPRRKKESIIDYNKRILAAADKKYGGKYEPYFEKSTGKNAVGMVKGFRVEMSEKLKRKELGFDITLSDSIANSIMTSKREVVYKQIINEVESNFITDVSSKKFSEKDFMKNMETEEKYLILKGSYSTIEKKINKHVLDTYYKKIDNDMKAMLPKELKGAGYINKQYADDLMGYRNEFLSKSRTGKLVEMYWRDLVNEFKASVIAKNPVALVTNFIGNTIMLLLDGASPLFIATELMRANKDIKLMYKKIEEMNNLQIRQEMYTPGSSKYKSNQAKIASLKSELVKSDAWIGIDSGWYQSAIDDFYDSRVTQNSPISRAADKWYRKALKKSGANDATVESIVKNTCNGLLTQNSKAGRSIQGVMSKTDYTARLVMYRLKRSQGMGKAEAAALARDSFVDYRKLLPKELNALRVNGVIPFATWAYRMQPVLARQALNNPIKVGAAFASYQAFSDDMGYTFGVRTESWLPTNALADTSILGGIPLDMAQGDMPTEAIVPELYGNLFTGNFDKAMGVNIR